MKSLRKIGKLFSMGIAGAATLFALNGDINKKGLEDILGSKAYAGESRILENTMIKQRPAPFLRLNEKTQQPQSIWHVDKQLGPYFTPQEAADAATLDGDGYGDIIEIVYT